MTAGSTAGGLENDDDEDCGEMLLHLPKRQILMMAEMSGISSTHSRRVDDVGVDFNERDTAGAKDTLPTSPKADKGQ